MEQPTNQFESPKSSMQSLPIIISVVLTALVIGGGIYWWANQKRTVLNNEIVSLRTQVDQLKQISTPAPASAQIQTETQNPAPIQSVVSNKFTYKSKLGDKVGEMVLSKINHPTSQTEPASSDNVYAEFTGTITVIGILSAPTGNPEDKGMGPEYSLNNLTQDSLKKLPYLQNDTRTVWFGVKNPDIMKNFPVKNGDLVEMTINKYEYVLFEAGVWNQVNVVTVKKI